MMDFLILTGPGIQGVRAIAIPKAEILVGRRTPPSSTTELDIDLQSDRGISRKHARIVEKDGCWFIEDLKTSNGTTIDGWNISGKGLVRLEAGRVVCTSDTRWTIVPRGYLAIHTASLLAVFECTSFLTFVYVHCGIRIVGDVRIVNFGPDRSSAATFLLEIPDYAERLSLQIPPLDPRASILLPPLQFRLSAYALNHLSEPARAILRVELHAGENALKEVDVTIVGLNAWPYEKAAVKCLAAFVYSRDPLVEKIVLQAENRLPPECRARSFRDLLMKNDGSAERKILESIYLFLSQQSEIEYADPSLERATSAQSQTFQMIRPPSRIFLSEPPMLAGKGTCIDIALLAAACLECAGVFPLVILTGREPFRPDHAFVGCRTCILPGEVPLVTDRQRLIDDTLSGRIVLVESTGVVLGGPYGSKLAWDEAVREADRLVKESPWTCCIDVGALRPPEGSITPLGYPYEPEVLRIYDEAEAFARHKGRRSIEARFLLYGIVRVGGEIAQWLLQELTGPARANVQEIIDTDVSFHEYSGTPVPTITYTECQQLAERYAWQAGCASVREQDLLWAFIDKGKANAGIRRLCRAVGIDIDSLAGILSRKCPRPSGIQTTVFSEF